MRCVPTEGGDLVSNPIDLIEERLHAAGKKVKRRGDRLDAQCPAHDDGSPSMSAAPGTSRDVIVYCFAGCRPDDILRALDLKWTDFGEPREEIERAYDYTDATGKLVYQVVRKSGKEFRQRRPDGAGKWIWNLRGVDPLIYKLPTIVAAARDKQPVYIVEGEKDADRLAVEGYTVTCNSGGAGKFPPTAARHFIGCRHVNIVADRDDAGVAHAHDIAKILESVSVPHSIVLAATGKDASDHLAFGHTASEFVPLEEVGKPTDINEPDYEWPDLIPLGEARDRPEFPTHVFPDWIADQVAQAGVEMQIAPDLPAQAAITALSIVCSKRLRIQVDGPWFERANIYLVTAMDSSDGKSPAIAMMIGPVEEIQSAMIERSVLDIQKNDILRRSLLKEQQSLINKGETSQALALTDELDKHPEIVEPRLIVDDVTPEKLGEMMAEQGGRIAIVSTEGGVFRMMAGGYKDSSDLDVYLKGWSGDTYSSDRISRTTGVVRQPAVTMGLAVQPSVISALADHPEFHGRGLIARIMFSMPPTKKGKRDKLRDSTYSIDVHDEYAKRLTDFARPFMECDEQRTMMLSPAARRRFKVMQQDHEDRMARGGDLEYLGEWIAKCQSSVARLAGLLQAVSGDTTNTIDVDRLEKAIEVGDYWIAHMKIAADLWGADPVITGARKIMEWVEQSGIERFSVRDAYGSNRRLFPKAHAVVDPLNLLTERGWLRPEFDGELVVGRRGSESPMFTVRGREVPNTTQRQGVAVHANHALKAEKRFSSSSSLEDPPDQEEMPDPARMVRMDRMTLNPATQSEPTTPPRLTEHPEGF